MTNAKLASNVLVESSDIKAREVFQFEASNLRILVPSRVIFNQAFWETAESNQYGFTHKIQTSKTPDISPKTIPTMFDAVLIDDANSTVTPVVCGLIGNSTVYVRSASSTPLALSNTAYLYGTVTYVRA